MRTHFGFPLAARFDGVERGAGRAVRLAKAGYSFGRQPKPVDGRPETGGGLADAQARRPSQSLLPGHPRPTRARRSSTDSAVPHLQKDPLP